LDLIKFAFDICRQCISFLETQLELFALTGHEWVVTIDIVFLDFFTTVFKSFYPFNNNSQHLGTFDLDALLIYLVISILFYVFAELHAN
jgi:hypothetical protein